MLQIELNPAERIRAHKERLASDFAYFAEIYCKIRDKDGNSVPFRLNRVQRDLLDKINEQWARDRRVRLVVLKARQQGFSTFMQAYAYWFLKHRSTKKGYVVANDLATSKTLFSMIQFTHKKMPGHLQPKLGKSSVREMTFSDLDTAIEVATAGSDALGRGQTLNLLWASELAYWDASTAKDNLIAILNAVPQTDGSIVVVESTADGVTGAYYDLYHDAKDQVGPGNSHNGFETFFAPWYHTAEYTDPELPHPDFGKPGSRYPLTPEEKDLLALAASQGETITLQQLNWRRNKLIQAKSREIFFRDFPAVPEEAFQNSGAPVFLPSAIEAQRANASKYITKMEYIEDRDVFDEQTQGDLTVYAEPEKGRTYFIGADVSNGTGKGDYSVAQVLDAQKRQVAIFRANTHSTRAFAYILNRLGRMYNDARICIEINSSGWNTADILAHEKRYPHIWRRVKKDKIAEEQTDTLGFITNKQTKPMIISRLREDLRNGLVKINCKVTLDEMRVFIRTDSDELKASPGKHDDCVMSLALALHINTGEYQPIPRSVMDASYLPPY